MKYFTLLENRTLRNDGYFKISFPVLRNKSQIYYVKKLSSFSCFSSNRSYHYFSLWITKHHRYIVLEVSKPSRSSHSFQFFLGMTSPSNLILFSSDDFMMSPYFVVKPISSLFSKIGLTLPEYHNDLPPVSIHRRDLL